MTGSARPWRICRPLHRLARPHGDQRTQDEDDEDVVAGPAGTPEVAVLADAMDRFRAANPATMVQPLREALNRFALTAADDVPRSVSDILTSLVNAWELVGRLRELLAWPPDWRDGSQDWQPAIARLYAAWLATPSRQTAEALYNECARQVDYVIAAGLLATDSITHHRGQDSGEDATGRDDG
jgi:hypothetical protein